MNLIRRPLQYGKDIQSGDKGHVDSFPVMDDLFIFLFTYDFMCGVGLGMNSFFFCHSHNIGGDRKGYCFFHQGSAGTAVINEASVVGNDQSARIE